MRNQTASSTVLVVEDEVFTRMMAVDVLQDAGFEVLEAGTAPEASAMLARNPQISAIFTDIQMPGAYDGLALANNVHRTRPDIRLVVTSALIHPRAGMMPDDGIFLPKPYGPAAMLSAVRGGH